MSRIDFINELERILSDIPIEERKEAIQYYNDYFADAGEDREEEIIKELGSPARVAGIIKADLNLSGEDHENRGYFTEKGFQDTVYTDEKYEIVKTAKPEREENQEEQRATASAGSTASDGTAAAGNGTGTDGGPGRSNAGTNGYQGTNSDNGNKPNNTNMALIILLLIFAIPIGLPLFFGFLGVAFGLVAASFGMVIGFGAAGVAMIAVGAALFVIGVVQINIPLALLALCGGGLFVFGLGILFLLASVMLCRKLIPAMIRGVVNLCRLPFKNRSVTV